MKLYDLDFADDSALFDKAAKTAVNGRPVAEAIGKKETGRLTCGH